MPPSLPPPLDMAGELNVDAAWAAVEQDDGKWLQAAEAAQPGRIGQLRNLANDTLIHAACFHGSEAALRTLLAIPGCVFDVPGSQGATPLHVAAYRGHSSCITTLIDHIASRTMSAGGDFGDVRPDAGPLANGSSVSSMATAQFVQQPVLGSSGPVPRTSSPGGSRNSPKGASRPLTTTVPAGASSTVLAKGATAVHLAAHAVQSSSTNALSTLLAVGSDAGATDHMGRTALHYLLLTTPNLLSAPPSRTLGFAAYDYVSLEAEAVGNIPEEMVEQQRQKEVEILERGMLLLCDVLGGSEAMDAADVHGATALHLAAARGLLGCLQALLETAADPTRSDKFNRTPLDIAATRAAHCAKAVAASGGATNSPRMARALDRASRAAAPCVALLREYGAPENKPSSPATLLSSGGGGGSSPGGTPRRAAAIFEKFAAGALQAHVRAAVSHSPSHSPSSGNGGRQSPRDSSSRGSGRNSPATAVPSRASGSRLSPSHSPPTYAQQGKGRISPSSADNAAFRSPGNSAAAEPQSHGNSPNDRQSRTPPNATRSHGMLNLSPAARAAIDENSLNGKK
jgi:hypothetical protein